MWVIEALLQAQLASASNVEGSCVYVVVDATGNWCAHVKVLMFLANRGDRSSVGGELSLACTTALRRGTR